MFAFFALSFAPAGVQFNTYSYSFVDSNDILMVNGVSVANPSYQELLNLTNSDRYNKIETSDGTYIIDKDFLSVQGNNPHSLILYDDAPAIRAELEGPIVGIDGVPITNWEEFADEMKTKSPGDTVIINTIQEGSPKDYIIILKEDNDEPGKAFLGIGYAETKRSGAMGKLVTAISSLKKEEIYYEGKFGASEFIYHMLWWLVLISFSVALVNMLPVGIFDGGRFFYLTVLGISLKLGVKEEKSEKIAKRAFKAVTWVFLFLLALIMFFWAKSFF